MLLLFFTNCKKQRTFESTYTKLKTELKTYGDAHWDEEGYVKKVILTTGEPETICCSFFEKTPELEELYIRHANIKGLNEKITRLKKLKVLHLDLQLLMEDIAILERLPQLEVLYIRSKAYKSLAAIDLNWQRFKNLRSLTVSYADPLTQFEVSLPTTVPADIFKLSNLEQLHVDGWNLSAFPAEIVALKNLYMLSMRPKTSLSNLDVAEFQKVLQTMDKLKFFKLNTSSLLIEDRSNFSGTTSYYDFYDVIIPSNENQIPLVFIDAYHHKDNYSFFYMKEDQFNPHPENFAPLCFEKPIQSKQLNLEHFGISSDYYPKKPIPLSLENKVDQIAYNLYAVNSCAIDHAHEIFDFEFPQRLQILRK